MIVEAKAADMARINEIAARVVAIYGAQRVPISRLQVVMDISMVHLNGCPLALKDMQYAPQRELMMCIQGIDSHLDRKTGKLADGWVPKFAKENISNPPKKRANKKEAK